jgi:hypothetical protein
MPTLVGNRFEHEDTLMLAGASTGWRPVFRFFPFTVDVSGSGSPWATLTIYVSNAPTAPTDTDANHSVLGTKTAPGSILSDGPYKWIKASGGAAGVNVYLSGASSVSSR